MPVDVRCEGKGYVLGAGSTLADGGRYELLELPDGLPPVMPPAMVRWLADHGYVEGEQPTGRATAGDHAAPLPSLSEVLNQRIDVGGKGGGRPDMTPIPAGRRNDTLHAWAYGRLKNHPDNATAIRDDLFRRGRASGLKDGELETIWRSINRELGGAA